MNGSHRTIRVNGKNIRSRTRIERPTARKREPPVGNTCIGAITSTSLSNNSSHSNFASLNPLPPHSTLLPQTQRHCRTKIINVSQLAGTQSLPFPSPPPLSSQFRSTKRPKYLVQTVRQSTETSTKPLQLPQKPSLEPFHESYTQPWQRKLSRTFLCTRSSWSALEVLESRR